MRTSGSTRRLGMESFLSRWMSMSLEKFGNFFSLMVNLSWDGSECGCETGFSIFPCSRTNEIDRSTVLPFHPIRHRVVAHEKVCIIINHSCGVQSDLSSSAESNTERESKKYLMRVIMTVP